MKYIGEIACVLVVLVCFDNLMGILPEFLLEKALCLLPRFGVRLRRVDVPKPELLPNGSVESQVDNGLDGVAVDDLLDAAAVAVEHVPVPGGLFEGVGAFMLHGSEDSRSIDFIIIT